MKAGKFREATQTFNEACAHVDRVENLILSLRQDALESAGDIPVTFHRLATTITIDVQTAIRGAESALAVAKADALTAAQVVASELEAVCAQMRPAK